MIENFKRIKAFSNKGFIKLINNKEFDKFLQDFANFIAKENNINNYIIEFNDDIEDKLEIGHFVKQKHQIILNSVYLDKYKELINKQDVNIEEEKFLKIYPYQLMSTIVHEMEHAKQYEMYLQDNTKYPNIENPFAKNPLYILQQTEKEAYKTEIDELDKLFSVINNPVEQDTINLYKDNLQEDILLQINNSIKYLQNGNFITKDNIYIDLDNITNENLAVFKEIHELIQKELIYLKEYQDIIEDDNKETKEYIDIKIDKEKSNLPYDIDLKIKNDNLKWNARLRLGLREVYFTLENNEVRINQWCKYKHNIGSYDVEAFNKQDETDVFPYINALVNMFPGEINKFKMSDILYPTYDNKLEFIKSHKGFFGKENTLKLTTSSIKSIDYENAYKLLDSKIDIDTKTKLLRERKINKANTLTYER